MPEQSSFVIDDFASFKNKALRWAQQFEYNLCLDNHFQVSPYKQMEFLLAVDAIRLLNLKNEVNQFDLFNAFQQEAMSSVFGYFSYDLKNELERLESSNPDPLNLASCVTAVLCCIIFSELKNTMQRFFAKYIFPQRLV